MQPTRPRTFDHMSNWCYLYQHSNIAPRTQADRFAIGLYQIGQGMSWPCRGPVSWQSYCSAALHWVCCLHAHNESMCGLLPETLAELPTEFIGWERFLHMVCKAQQQVVYASSHNLNTTRASRFKLDTLRHQLADLVSASFSLVPRSHREQGCYDEMIICTKDLIKKKTPFDQQTDIFVLRRVADVEDVMIKAGGATVRFKQGPTT
jgi:hypothetical protein